MNRPAHMPNIDRLNTVLIAVSMVLAIRWPFETLLLAYAVLGPLHYMTEISWLHDRNYFLPKRSDAWPMVLGGIVLLVAVGSFANANKSALHLAVENGGLFLLFAFPLVVTVTPHWHKRLLLLAVLIPACYLLARSFVFADSLAGYLPTVIHVYVFTGLFLVLGWLRRPSRDSAGTLIAFLLCPLLCWLVPLDWSATTAPWAERSFVGTLRTINDRILGDAGMTMSSEQIIEHPLSILITRLLALAYLYHYLNWFSKIELIGWARISPARGVAIALLWLGAVALYFYHYILGFAVLLMLSFMHVVLEFPLNHRSFRDIGGLLGAKLSARPVHKPL